jgi:hypothetical protein
MPANRRPLIIALVILGACVCLGTLSVLGTMALLAPLRAQTGGEFAGYFTSGFEVSSFVPCDAQDAPGYGAGYWLSAAPGAGFFERYSEISQGVSPPPGGYVTVFTRFRGTLSPPGNYGHLGAYSHEVTVIELIEMSLDGTCQP